MLTVEALAVVILMLTTYCDASTECNDSVLWIEDICPPAVESYKCLYGYGQEIRIKRKDMVRVLCNNDVLDNKTIECANITTVAHLEMNQCELRNFKMKEFLADRTPKSILIVGSVNDKLSLEVEFYNLHSLQNLDLVHVRTGGSFDILLEALDSLQNLRIVNHDFNKFPSQPLKHLKSLTNFVLQNGTISTFPPHLLDKLYRLKNLDLRFNQITNIMPQAFKDLTELRRLDLSHNNIQKLEAELFKSLSLLVILFISFNKITVLPIKLFSFTPNLYNLNMDANEHIGVLPKEFFRGAKSLTTFSASYCGLTVIDKELFHQPNLAQRQTQSTYFRKLLRRVNFLTSSSVNENTFKPVYALNSTGRYRFLSQENHQRLLTDFGSLATLNLSHNQIPYIEESTLDPLTGLKVFDASNNLIMNLPEQMPFGSSLKLQKVFLRHCKLTTIPNDIYSKYKLRMIDLSYNQIINVTLLVYSRENLSVELSYNQIQNIKLHFTTTLDYRPTYNIEGNPLLCDCELEEFLQFLHSENKKSKRVFSDAENVKCSPPNDTLTLLQVLPNNLTCRIENCPDFCKCSKPNSEEIEANCSNKGIVSAPHILPQGIKILRLQNNNISTLHFPQHHSWSTLTKLFLSNNSLTSLKTWLNIPHNLITLAIDNNKLEDLPLSVRKIVNSSRKFRIHLSGNKWVCECRTYSLLKWTKINKDRIVDYESMTCLTTDRNETVYLTPIEQVDVEQLCDDARNSSLVDVDINTELIASLSAAIIATTLLVIFVFSYLNRYSILALLYARNMYKIPQIKTNLLFDSFILFNEADYNKVRKIFNTAKSEYKLCVHGRTKLPEEAKGKNMSYGMKNSRTTTLVVSAKFTESRLFQMQFRKAYQELYVTHRHRFILIFVGKVDTKFLPRDLRYLLSADRKIKWEERLFWEKLRFFLAPPSKKIRRKRQKQTKDSRPNGIKKKPREKGVKKKPREREIKKKPREKEIKKKPREKEIKKTSRRKGIKNKPHLNEIKKKSRRNGKMKRTSPKEGKIRSRRKQKKAIPRKMRNKTPGEKRKKRMK